jgi:bifunctional non-homologous end joining protein LigD
MTPHKTPHKTLRKAPRTRTHAVDPTAIEVQLRMLERSGDDGELDFGGGRTLHVSGLDKLFFREVGVTKGALMRYYTRISPLLLPEMEDRALVLKRYPDGVSGPLFFQQNAGASVPDAVRVESLDTESEGPKPRIIGGDLPTLLYTVQLGAIEVHPWLSRVQSEHSPSHCLIDLDPGDDVALSAVASLAQDVVRVVEECELPVAVKTSGSTGIHLVIPLPARTSFDRSAELAMLIAEIVVAQRPEIATTERSVKARPPHSIYVDAMQNARGKSMASAYSVRARPTATVSAPLRPRELTARLSLSAFTVKTMLARVARTGNLWAEAMAQRPTTRALTRAIAALTTVRAGSRSSTATSKRRSRA